MLANPPHPLAPYLGAESAHWWQGDVYYDCQEYEDFPLRNDAPGTALSLPVFQASKVPLSEDGRRCLIRLFSALAEYQQSHVLQALASSQYLGLPIQIATLAQSLYTALIGGQNRPALLMASLTLTCRYLLDECHPLVLLAGHVRQCLREWIGDPLIATLFGQDLAQENASASLLAFGCCAVAIFLCRDTPDPQRYTLRLPLCLVTLLCKAQLYWSMLDDIASQASSRRPAPLMITARAQKREPGARLCRSRSARLSWEKAVEKRLDIGATPSPPRPKTTAMSTLARSGAQLAVASLHPSALLPAAMASGAGASPWPKKLLWATASAAGLSGAYHLWPSWLTGATAAVPPTTSAPQTLALRQSRPQVGRNASKFPFTFDQYDPDVLTHARYGTLLRPFIEKHVPTDFYRLYFNSLLNRAIARPAIAACKTCPYALFVSEIYRQTVDELHFIQTLSYTINISLPDFPSTLHTLYLAMREEWRDIIDTAYVVETVLPPLASGYEQGSKAFTALRQRLETRLPLLDLPLLKNQLLTLLFYRGKEQGGNLIIPLEFCRQIYPELKMGLMIHGDITRSVINYLTEILYRELYDFQIGALETEKNIIEYHYTNPKEIFLTLNNNEGHSPISRSLVAMLVYKRLLPALEYLQSNGKQGRPSLPLPALEHLITALIQGAGPWPTKVRFPKITVGMAQETATAPWPSSANTTSAPDHAAAAEQLNAGPGAAQTADPAPTPQDYTLAGLTLAGLAAVATIYGYKATVGGPTPSVAILGGSAGGVTFGAITAVCTHDMGVAGIAAFNAGLMSGMAMGGILENPVGENRHRKRSSHGDRRGGTLSARTLFRGEASADGVNRCPILAPQDQDRIAGRHPFYYAQQWLEPAVDKVLYFGHQEAIDDPHYDYMNEAVELAHHYLRQITVMIEALTEKFITRRPLFMRRVRDYLQCTLDNGENEILAHAEQQLMDYCQRARQFLNEAKAVNFTNIVIIATRHSNLGEACLLRHTRSNLKQLPLVYGAQQYSLQGLVFIADALLCHPDRWRGPSATISLTRIDEDVLRATLQISSVLNDYIPLTQDSLTPLPNQKTVNTVMAHSLNTLDKRSGLYQFLGDYAAVNNVRLPSNLTTALTQHKTLKANVIMKNVDHVAMILKTLYLQESQSPP
ncbi:hypothetical protein [Sodalis praecaptivus]|nr:hypothetical protein [Sodalis praecaptivus]